MTKDMMKEARMAVEALEAEGFVLMTGREGTSFYIQDPDAPAALDENGLDIRERFNIRRRDDVAFRSAVKSFMLAERPFGAASS